MTLEEFYDEMEFEAQEKGLTTKLAIPIKVGELVDDGLEEVLPEGITKTYCGGEIVYLKITEDGRQVRVDDWLAGVV